MIIKNLKIQSFKGIREFDIPDCGPINAFIGKNNVGKSSILHAINLADLAFKGRWDSFIQKLDIGDLFNEPDEFEIRINFQNEKTYQITINRGYHAAISPESDEHEPFRSILIYPESDSSLLRRQRQSPKNVIQHIEANRFSMINALDILYALKFYAKRNQREFVPENYDYAISEIQSFFPELEAIESDRTEEDISTLLYEEDGKKFDILYSGAGLKHFLDILIKTVISKANVLLLDEPERSFHPDLQRQLLDFLQRLVDERGIQVFMATHSQVLLNYGETIHFYRVVETGREKRVDKVPEDALYTLMGDLGIKPSDLFHQDLCILVEGASDVIFFEHIIRVLYRDKFQQVAIGIQQYGGSAAEGIVSGSINVENLTTAQNYIFWIRDRDAKPDEQPASEATRFRNKLDQKGFECHIWAKREIEFYYPEEIHVDAQQGDPTKERATRSILNGTQEEKYSKAAENADVCVPQGTYLRRLFRQHLTSRDQLDSEIREIVEETLIAWRNEILGIDNE